MLAASSSFMKSAFTVGLVETSTASVSLEEMEAAVFEAVLEFVYAGTCTFSEPLALEVLRAASRLGIKPLEAEVVAHVTKTIKPLSCLSVWRAGDLLMLHPLVEAATKCAKEAFATVATTEEFLGVGAPWLESLLASDELVVDAEEQVFEALQRWHASQRPPPSHEALDRLLALVRWPLMNQGFVAENVNTAPMVRSHLDGMVTVLKAFQDALYGAWPKQRLGNGTVFRFASPFDGNGLLYHLGTGGSGAHCDYRNPHEAGEVVVSTSSAGSVYDPNHFVQHDYDANGWMYNHTQSVPTSWMAVDLGGGRSLVVDYYCLRSDCSIMKLRNWDLQGSVDGQAWEMLRRHQSDDSFALQAFSTAAWPVDAGGKAFRHFRILQTGPNRSNTNHLMCAGIELYGHARLRR